MNSHQRRKAARKLKREFGNPILIKNWEQLAKVPESKTHRLEIDVENCNGWIIEKDIHGKIGYYYLSTHTFYGSSFKSSTKALKDRGFNVIILNWDK